MGHANEITLHESRYHRLVFDPSRQEAMYAFNEATREMEDEEYRANLLEASQAMLGHAPILHVVSDFRKFYFTIPPDTQEWIAQEVVPLWMKAGVRKSAILLPSDLIAELSISQAVDETAEKAAEFSNRYFPDLTAARKWFAEG